MRHPTMVAQDAFNTIVKYVYITKKKAAIQDNTGFGLQEEFSANVLRVRNVIQRGH